jgi:hypothetical protein
VGEFTFSTQNINVPPVVLKGQKTPNNYRIEFKDVVVDSCLDTLGVPAIPVNFNIYNTTLEKYTEFVVAPTGDFINLPKGYYELVPNDGILFFETGQQNTLEYTWILNFKGDTLDIQPGDVLRLSVTKAFRNGDEFLLETTKPTVDQEIAQAEMDKIRVVPNPYVVAHAHEAPLPPNVTRGRGERKITFTHLPQKSEIQIFTSRGEHVVTLDADNAANFNGTAIWNLKTKENLDIAYGVYFYVIKSPVGEKKGKIAIIK